MTASRFLPILNLVGCVLVTTVILAQWRKEHTLGERIKIINQELVASRDETAAAQKRSTALEADVAQLKESIEATAASHQAAEEEAVRVAAENQQKITEFVTAANEQAEVWKTAIAERDTKITDLSNSLEATRKRLDQAIAKLKEAGAR